MTDHIRDVAQPTPEAVAWRVKNDHGHWYVTQHKDLADTWRDFEGYEVQDLYVAQPPAAPVETVAWIAFAGNGNIRFWTVDEERAKLEKARGLDLRAFSLAELIALASKAPQSCSAGNGGEK